MLNSFVSASSPPEMKQTQKIKTPIPHGSHVDCSASLTKLTALQAPIAILSGCVYGRPGFTGGKNDIGVGTDTDFIGACTPALRHGVGGWSCCGCCRDVMSPCTLSHALLTQEGLICVYAMKYLCPSQK